MQKQAGIISWDNKLMTTIDAMSLNELEHVVNWAADEGWNPGIDDAAAFFEADPDGFFLLKDGETKIAAISVVKQGEQHAFLGLYICHSDYRGLGYGWKVWNAGIEYLKDHTIGLDGVPEQQANYQRSGFEYHYRNIRFAGDVNRLSTFTDQDSANTSPSVIVRTPRVDDFQSMFKLDSIAHGFTRHKYIKNWLSDTQHRHTLICIDQDKVLGFGTIRECLDGFKIGPLIAHDSKIARRLITSLVQRVGATKIILDVPEPNTGAIDLVNELELTPVFETARMYRGNAPDYQLPLIFGVTTFELG